MSLKPCLIYDIRSGKPVLIGNYNDALQFLVDNPDIEQTTPASIGGMNAGSISSLADRFRGNNATKISLNIKGPNGAVLTSYQWASEEVAPKQMYKGKVVAKAVRVSDWKEAAANAETGRSIVHKFTVKLPDGTQRTVSAESLPSALGYTSKEFEDVFPNAKNILQSIAKLRMREQSLIDYLDSVKPIEKEAESKARQEQEKQAKAEKKRIADEWSKKRQSIEPLFKGANPDVVRILQKELDKGPEVFNELGFGEFLFDELYGKNLKELGVYRHEIRDAQMDLNKTRDKIENKYKQLAESVPESSATPDLMEEGPKVEKKEAPKQEVKEDPIEAYFKSLLDQTKNTTGLNAALYRGMVQAILSTYQAGKNVAKAIQAGIDYLIEQGVSQEEAEAEAEKIRVALPKEAVPPPTGTTTETGEGEGPQMKKSRLAQRAVEGESADEFADAMEEIGYLYKVESVKKAGEAVKKLFEQYGPDEIIDFIREGKLDGAVASRAWVRVLDLVNEQFLTAKTKEEAEAALAKNLQLAKELSLLSTGKGQFIKGLADAYLESDFGFDVASMTNALKEASGGELSKEMQDKIKEWGQQIADLTKRLAEVETEKKALEEKQILDNYVEEENNKPQDNRPQAIKDAAKAAAARVRKLKTSRPSYMYSSNPAFIAWDAAVEGVASAIEAGGNVAQAIEKGLKVLRESDWYKSVSKDIQKKVEDDFATQNADNAAPKPEYIDGKVKVTRGAIAALVRQGYDTIDKVVDKVAEMLDNPNLTKRQIRDAITGYGKTINPTKDEVQLKIQEITRIGQKISQIEDARKKIRPLRSGKQRAKLVEEERRLQKELNQLLKELPPSDVDLTKAIKTALDGIKTRLTNQIEDLNRQIEKKERLIKTKTSPTYDAEATALKEQRDALLKTLDDLVGKQDISDEQKIKNAIEAVEKSLAEYQRRIDEKDFSTPEQKKGPESEELKKLRAERDKIKEEYETLKKGPPKTEEQKKLDGLQKQLDKLLAGEVKDTKDKTPDSSDVKRLKEAIAAQKAAMGLIPGKQTEAEKQYEAALRGAKKRLANLEEKIEKNALAMGRQIEKQFGPELDATRKRADEAQKVLDALRKEAGVLAQHKLDMWKKSAQKSIDMYRERLKTGNFSPKPKEEMARLDQEAKDLLSKKIRVKEQYMKALAEQKERNESYTKYLIKTGAGLLRLLLATGEWSFVTIQNGMVASGMALRDPARLKQAFKDTFKGMASRGYAEKLVEDVKSQDWYPELKASGLNIIDDFTAEGLKDETAHFTIAQEGWRALEYPVRLMTFGDVPTRTKDDIAHEIFGPANPIEALERAANAFGNSMRVAEFLRGRQMLLNKGITFEDNPEAYKQLGAGINTMTARTSLGKAESISPFLNVVLFSARNWASVLKNLPPIAFFYYGPMNEGAKHKTVVTPERKFKFKGVDYTIPSKSFSVPTEASPIQKMYVQNFLSQVSLTMGLVGSFALYQALKTMGDDEEEKEKYDGPKVEFDPRSAGFAKVQFGNQYYDPWGGKQQQIVLMARIFADILIDQGYVLEGSYKSLTTGNVSRLGESEYVPSKGELVQNMIRNKMSPAAGLGYDYMFSTLDTKEGTRELNGRQLDLNEQFYTSFKPMYWQSIKETAEEQPALTGAFLDAMGFIGHSVSTIKPKEKTQAQQARAVMNPDEPEQKRSKELLKSAIEKNDTKLAGDAIEKYIKAFPTKEQKLKAVESIIDSELSEDIMGKVGIKSEYVNDFFQLYNGAEVRMGGKDSERNYEITHIKKVLENKATAEDIVRKYEAAYEKAKATREMLISLDIKNPISGKSMRVKNPSWMRDYEKNIAPQMPAKAAPVKKEETSWFKKLFNNAL